MAIIEHAVYYENIINQFSHTHTSCEIMYIVSGSVRVNDGGSQSYLLTDNDCLLIKSRQFHNTNPADKAEYKRFIAVINPWDLKKQLVRPDLFALLTDKGKSGFVHLKNVPQLKQSFEKMADIFQNGGNIFKELSAVLEVIAEIYETIAPRTKYTAEYSAKRLADKVREYIERNYADKIKVEQIAADNFVSVGYLSHAFKAETGMSPRQYLTHIRCTRAYELICHTGMTFADISENTGFCCANDMSRKIREYYGKTPSALRFGR